jgi:imidazole glycerol-phosphate synthase subunit HisH
MSALRCTLFDYGAGNLHSLLKALEPVTGAVRVTTDAADAVREAELLVLPGVGAFGLAAERLLAGREVMQAAIRGGLPTLGICLGMQLFFEESDEAPGLGLSVMAGRVRRLTAARVPQIGWNTVDDGTDPALQAAPLPAVYYANGYVCAPEDAGVVTAWTTHEADRFPAMVRQGALVGVQFHPEKSSAAGVAFVHEVVRQAVGRTPAFPVAEAPR